MEGAVGRRRDVGMALLLLLLLARELPLLHAQEGAAVLGAPTSNPVRPAYPDNFLSKAFNSLFWVVSQVFMGVADLVGSVLSWFVRVYQLTLDTLEEMLYAVGGFFVNCVDPGRSLHDWDALARLTHFFFDVAKHPWSWYFEKNPTPFNYCFSKQYPVCLREHTPHAGVVPGFIYCTITFMSECADFDFRAHVRSPWESADVEEPLPAVHAHLQRGLQPRPRPAG